MRRPSHATATPPQPSRMLLGQQQHPGHSRRRTVTAPGDVVGAGAAGEEGVQQVSSRVPTAYSSLLMSPPRSPAVTPAAAPDDDDATLLPPPLCACPSPSPRRPPGAPATATRARAGEKGKAGSGAPPAAAPSSSLPLQRHGESMATREGCEVLCLLYSAVVELMAEVDAPLKPY